MTPARAPRHLRLAAVLAAAVAVLGCRHATASGAAAPTPAPVAREGVRHASVAEYLRALPPPPIVVGFDVDDTALFSTPAFLYARGNLLPEPPAPGASAEDEVSAWRDWARRLEERREALFQRMFSRRSTLAAWDGSQWERFWDDVNTKGDTFSPPKAAARQIIEHHLARGDEVVFITARPKARVETLTAKLREDFGPRVRLEFTGGEPKVRFLRDARVTIFYGDADADIVDANAAGARGVRILRSRYSSNPSPTAAGTKGEWFVIDGSEL